MANDIMISAAGTVTIETGEYRRLIRRSAYLDMILTSLENHTYCSTDVTDAVKKLVQVEDTTEITIQMDAADKGDEPDAE